MDSPVGKLTLIASAEGLHAVGFDDQSEKLGAWTQQAGHAHIDAAERQLREYFAGKRRAFDIPLAPKGTPFQLSIWKLLLEIPFGETSSYGALAERSGDRKRMRAVGMANGKNPIAIIIPCHRVIGSQGKLTGFGGGLPRKEWLLSHERRVSGRETLLDRCTH